MEVQIEVKSSKTIALSGKFAGYLEPDVKVKSLMENSENMYVNRRQKAHKCKVFGKEGKGNVIRLIGLTLKPNISRALSFLEIIVRKHSGVEFLKAITCGTTTKVFIESNSTIFSRTRLAQMMHNVDGQTKMGCKSEQHVHACVTRLAH